MMKKAFKIISLLTIFLFAKKVKSLQCHVPGECNFSPVIDISIEDEYNYCLYNAGENNATWFSFDPNSNVCEMFSSCTNLTTDYCKECISGEVGCQPLLCNAVGTCEVST